MCFKFCQGLSHLVSFILTLFLREDGQWMIFMTSDDSCFSIAITSVWNTVLLPLCDLLLPVTWVWLTCHFFRGAFAHSPTWSPYGPVIPCHTDLLYFLWSTYCPLNSECDLFTLSLSVSPCWDFSFNRAVSLGLYFRTALSTCWELDLYWLK